jgi:hypothetical protein
VIKIAISQAAFEAIASTLPLGSMNYENATNERGERLICWTIPSSLVSGPCAARARATAMSYCGWRRRRRQRSGRSDDRVDGLRGRCRTVLSILALKDRRLASNSKLAAAAPVTSLGRDARRKDARPRSNSGSHVKMKSVLLAYTSIALLVAGVTPSHARDITSRHEFATVTANGKQYATHQYREGNYDIWQGKGYFIEVAFFDVNPERGMTKGWTLVCFHDERYCCDSNGEVTEGWGNDSKVVRKEWPGETKPDLFRERAQ